MNLIVTESVLEMVEAKIIFPITIILQIFERMKGGHFGDRISSPYCVVDQCSTIKPRQGWWFQQ